MIKDGRNAYGSVSKILHWIMAVLIVGLVIVGSVMVDALSGDWKWFLYGMHKSVGLTVLILSGLRLVWRLFNQGPKTAPGSRLMQIGGRLVHGGLYAMMFFMPISGLLMSLYGGHGVSFFGLYVIEPMTTGPTEFGAVCRTVHVWSSYGLVTLFILHVGGALFHHFIIKDETVRRMMPFFKK